MARCLIPLESLANCYNRALSEHGYPTHEIDAYRYFIGDGAIKCVERCLPEYARDTASVEQLLETQRADYQKSWKDKAAPYPGILTLLNALGQKGIIENARFSGAGSFLKDK